MNLTEPIFTTRHLRTLAGFALSNVLVAFDYDGTLAPIADRREDELLPETRALLTSVARAYPTVVISRVPRQPRTIRLLLSADELPVLQPIKTTAAGY